MSEMTKRHPLRFLARITVEAATPVAVGTGDAGLTTDVLVATDVNGLPMLPGTSLCGVLRSLAESGMGDAVNDLFGFQGERRTDRENADGAGARLILSSGRMVGDNGKAQDGLVAIDWTAPFYRHFLDLPVRDHCCITHRGAAYTKGRAKFDEQVVYKGSSDLVFPQDGDI